MNDVSDQQESVMQAEIAKAIGVFLAQYREIRECRRDRTEEGQLLGDCASLVRTWAYPEEAWMLAWVAILSMRRMDHCDLLDALWGHLEPLAPIPGYEGLQAEAQNWVKSTPYEARRVFFWEIWQSLPRDKQAEFIKHIKKMEGANG